MNKGGFSWKRFTGVSRVKSSLSCKIGIPFSKTGRDAKIGRFVTGGGCCLAIAVGLSALVFLTLLCYVAGTA